MNIESRIRKIENTVSPEIVRIKEEIQRGEKFINEIITQENFDLIKSNPKLLKEIQQCTEVVFIED